MRVAFCCDAGPAIGVGHVMRCLALAEELSARGSTPVFVADLAGVPWARAQVERRGFAAVPPAARYVDGVLATAPSAVVLDSYLLPAEISRDLRHAGLPVLAIVDGDPRGQLADVYVDQNLGAEDDDPALPDGAIRLAGLRFAMLRSEVIDARQASPDVSGRAGTPRVLAFFGGTDAFGAAPVLVRALAASGCPFDATVVAARDDLVARVREVPLAEGQRVDVIAPTDRIASLVVGTDLVLAASGTSIWELLCLGAAAALVRVADNQVVGYDRTVATGAVAGLGALADVDADPSAAARTLAVLLTDRDGRAALRRKGRDLVDGRGRRRVADALAALVR